MRQILEGTICDTETATELAFWHNGCGEFRRVEETLYQNEDGEFFLYGQGGQMTEYLSEKILTPFTEEEAREWCEQHTSADTYIEIFATAVFMFFQGVKTE